MAKINLATKIVITFCILFCTTASAGSVQEHSKIWTSVPITGSITENKKWKYYLEPQLRLIDDKYKFDQVNLYAGIYYQAAPTLSFWLGAFKHYKQNPNGSTSQQYRLWEQIVWDIIPGHSQSVSSRSRLEQRKNFIYSQIANRFREKITLKFPVNLAGQSFLVLSEEVFIQLNRPEWVTNRVFSQNRASLGVEIPISKYTSFGMGYLNQYQFGAPDEMNNVLYFTLAMNLD